MSGAPPPLGKNTNILSPPAAKLRPGERRKRRRALRDGVEAYVPATDEKEARYKMRAANWDLASSKRQQKCGRCRMQSDVLVKIVPDEGAHFSGLVTCGSVHCCPVCSAVIQCRRREQLQEAEQRARAEGWGYLHVTVTGRHDVETNFPALYVAMSEAFSHSRSGAPWQRWCERWGVWTPVPTKSTARRCLADLGGKRRCTAAPWVSGLCAEHAAELEEAGELATVSGRLRWNASAQRIEKRKIGTIRATDATVGKNGIHGHFHTAFVVARPMSDDEAEELRAFLFERYAAHLRAAGFDALEFDPETGEALGIDVRQTPDLGDYLAKLPLAWELTSSQTKGAARGSRTMWEVLRDVATYNRKRDRAIWREWSDAMHGKNSLVWSQGLKAVLLGIPDEEDATDEEIAEQEAARGVEAARIPGPTWDLLAHVPEAQIAVLWAAPLGQAAVDSVIACMPLDEVPAAKLAKFAALQRHQNAQNLGAWLGMQGRADLPDFGGIGGRELARGALGTYAEREGVLDRMAGTTIWRGFRAVPLVEGSRAVAWAPVAGGGTESKRGV